MSDAPAPTRAEEGRGTGQIAYEAWVEGERFNLVSVSNLPLTPWRSLSDKAKVIWEAIERKSAAQAEAEVARLTAALAEAERERDGAWLIAESWEATAGAEAEIGNERQASASALRERVATLEAALQPFANYAADMPGADFGEGEIGEYYHDGFRRSIRTQDLRAARTALEAPHADK